MNINALYSALWKSKEIEFRDRVASFEGAGIIRPCVAVG